MIIKIDRSYHDKLLKVLKREPEFNLFMIGDIENYGYDNYFLEFWGQIDKKKNIVAVLMKYFDYLMFYSIKDEFDKNGFAKVINELDYVELSGKLSCVEVLAKELNLSDRRNVKFSTLKSFKEINKFEINNRVKKIRFGNIGKVVKLYEVIDEFQNTSIESIKTGLKSGRGYCIEIDRKVVAMAKSTAENNTHAMVVGVGTHPDYRNRGLATDCMIKLCNALMKEGKTPCLFYDNEKAGNIYKKLGFENIGVWTIFYR